jgi:hypothetical protein
MYLRIVLALHVQRLSSCYKTKDQSTLHRTLVLCRGGQVRGYGTSQAGKNARLTNLAAWPLVTRAQGR